MESSKHQWQSKSEGDSDEETVKLKSEIETLKAVKSKLLGTIFVACERKYLRCSLEIMDFLKFLTLKSEFSNFLTKHFFPHLSNIISFVISA